GGRRSGTLFVSLAYCDLVFTPSSFAEEKEERGPSWGEGVFDCDVPSFVDCVSTALLFLATPVFVTIPGFLSLPSLATSLVVFIVSQLSFDVSLVVALSFVQVITLLVVVKFAGSGLTVGPFWMLSI